MANTDSEEKSKGDVYRERNLLALAFIARTLDVERSRENEPAHGWWPDTDDVNGEEWAVVWIETQHGQVGWHVGMDMLPDYLPKRDPEYDGYSTDVKNARVAKHVYYDHTPLRKTE
jgi:hypothetical protein